MTRIEAQSFSDEMEQRDIKMSIKDPIFTKQSLNHRHARAGGHPDSIECSGFPPARERRSQAVPCFPNNKFFLTLRRVLSPWPVTATFIICPLAPALASQPGQDYPTKPIRIVTTEVGGGTDVGARAIAQGLSIGPIGQQVIVENRGGGVIAGTIVSRASPDGYTLLYYGNSLWILPLVRKDIPYDTVKDFAPITLGLSQSQIMAVHPSVPVKTVKEFIAYARAKPGSLNYGSGAAGGTNHLAAELFKSMASVNIMRISFKGTGPALNALLGGEIQVMFTAPSATMPNVKGGRLKALATTGARPSGAFPDLPTISASGLPGYEATQTSGLFAPARTPAAIIKKLNQEVVRVLNMPEVKQRFVESGSDVVANSPEEFAAVIKSDRARLGKVIREAGIRDE
jgi:tripartite-type tricarboxylate transporter receptor subunit TctC